jgi:hypothetical protein
MLLSHLSKLVSEIKKTFTKYSQDPGLANHRYISILRNEALKNEPGLLSIFEIEHVVHVGRSLGKSDFMENLELYGKIKLKQNIQSMIVNLSESLMEKLENTKKARDSQVKGLHNFTECLKNIIKLSGEHKDQNLISLLPV